MHEWNRFSWSAWCLREFWILSVPVVVVDAFYVLCWILFSFFAQLFCRNFCHIFFCAFFLSVCCWGLYPVGIVWAKRIDIKRSRESTLATNAEQNSYFDRSCNKPNHRTTIIWGMSFEKCMRPKFCLQSSRVRPLDSHLYWKLYVVSCCFSFQLSLSVSCVECVCVFTVNVVIVVAFRSVSGNRLQIAIHNTHTHISI